MGKTDAALTLRPARRNDAADLAILDNLAGHGIPLWFWQGAVNMGEAEEAFSLGRARIMDDDAPYGWSNTMIADRDGITLGHCNAYIMPEPDPEDEKRNPEPFVPVFELFEKAVGDWLVDSLAVYAEARGQGVGEALLKDALQRGQNAGCATIALVAEDANAPALALYRKLGLEAVASRPFIPFGEESKTENWLLMKRSL